MAANRCHNNCNPYYRPLRMVMEKANGEASAFDHGAASRNDSNSPNMLLGSIRTILPPVGMGKMSCPLTSDVTGPVHGAASLNALSGLSDVPSAYVELGCPARRTRRWLVAVAVVIGASARLECAPE
jgi:hypothetical protein